MKKKYKIKKTKTLIKKLQIFLNRYRTVETIYYELLEQVEKDMKLVTGIKDIEFFFCDGEFSGIGNTSRTMELIHRHELEEGDIDEEKN